MMERLVIQDYLIHRGRNTTGLPQSSCVDQTREMTLVDPQDIGDDRRSGDHDFHTSSEYEDDDNLTPWEYAVRYGLISPNLARVQFTTATWAPSSDTIWSDLQGPQCTLHDDTHMDPENLANINGPEKWEVDKETASLLASVIALGKDEGPTCSPPHSGCLHLRDLKLGERILSSDPETDIWRLKQRNRINISSHGQPRFELDDEEGESFAWSAAEHSASARTDEVAANEKLDVGHETREHLKEVMELGHAPIEEASHLDVGNSGHTADPLTPPLLPMSSPLTLGSPASLAMDIDLTSTPESTTTNEVRWLEKVLMKNDTLSPPALALKNERPGSDLDVDSKMLYSPLQAPEISSSSPSRRRRTQDFEVDVPLIPDESVEMPPTKQKGKSVSFPAEIHTIIPTSESEALTSDLKQEPDSHFTNMMVEHVVAVNQKLGNEHLFDLDTTMRIGVPRLEDAEPHAPWKLFGYGASAAVIHKTIVSSVEGDDMKQKTRWGGTSEIDQLLSWSPFPTYLGRAQLDETFDDGSLARYTTAINFESDINVEELTWKPEGLRILDDEESDNEELEVESWVEEDGDREGVMTNFQALTYEPDAPRSPFRTAFDELKPDRMDMQTLLRKRKLELEGAIDSERPAKQLDQSKTTQAQMDQSILGAGPCKGLANIDSLSSFMQLHSGPLHKYESAIRPPPTTAPRLAASAVTEPLPDQRNEAEDDVKLPLPAPDIYATQKAPSIVISTTIATNRELIRQLLSALPSLDIIERDPINATMINETAHRNMNKYEADVSISPSTGLVLTTLQKAKQKPLPGRSTFLGVRGRLKSVASRYERLIVLLSQGRRFLEGDVVVASSIDESDTEVLANLIGDGAAIDADVEVYFVPGGDFELAQWIAASISRQWNPDTDTKLLHEETVWERFLRHAGMNPYAAQAILSQLKPPEDNQIQASSSTPHGSVAPHYGLAAFAQLDAAQRIERFSSLVGGERVLQRVSAVIDRGWMSATTTKRRQ